MYLVWDGGGLSSRTGDLLWGWQSKGGFAAVSHAMSFKVSYYIQLSRDSVWCFSGPFSPLEIKDNMVLKSMQRI